MDPHLSTEGHVSEGRVPVADGEVWYRIVGRKQSGVPLLILHGGPGAPHDYLEPLAALADERPVVFYDQLGCGRSDHPKEPFSWTIEHFVAEVAAVRSALGLQRVHLLGQSWGTMLAVDYMLTGPVGVASLVLSAPALSAAQWAADARALIEALPIEARNAIEVAEASGDFGAAAYTQAMATFYNRHLCRLDPWPDCLTRTAEALSHPVYSALWGPSEFTVHGALKDYDRVDRLREIAVPALFTCGRYDEATPAATERYHRHLPGSEMIVFEEASHEHHLEQPDGYLAAVRSFLRRAEAARPIGRHR